jgi:hypothetical protein
MFRQAVQRRDKRKWQQNARLVASEREKSCNRASRSSFCEHAAKIQQSALEDSRQKRGRAVQVRAINE